MGFDRGRKHKGEGSSDGLSKKMETPLNKAEMFSGESYEKGLGHL